jgi:hypothetical protein
MVNARNPPTGTTQPAYTPPFKAPPPVAVQAPPPRVPIPGKFPSNPFPHFTSHSNSVVQAPIRVAPPIPTARVPLPVRMPPGSFFFYYNSYFLRKLCTSYANGIDAYSNYAC